MNRAPSRQQALLRASRRGDPNDVVATPAALFRDLDWEFRFTVDVCATPENAKCVRFFTEADNGLVAPLTPGDVAWCNPPYSNIGPWAERAYLEAAAGRATFVLLVPAWTDRRWFHTWALRASEIRFIEGRVTFPGFKRGGNPYPFMLVIFRAGAVAP